MGPIFVQDKENINRAWIWNMSKASKLTVLFSHGEGLCYVNQEFIWRELATDPPWIKKNVHCHDV